MCTVYVYVVHLKLKFFIFEHTHTPTNVYKYSRSPWQPNWKKSIIPSSSIIIYFVIIESRSSRKKLSSWRNLDLVAGTRRASERREGCYMMAWLFNFLSQSLIRTILHNIEIKFALLAFNPFDLVGKKIN